MMNEYAALPETASRRSVQVPLLDAELSSEVAGDFSLPDYQPEIKRLLRIRAVPLPATCTGGAVSGTLDYYVLYMGHDNALYCAPLSTEYRIDATETDDRRLADRGISVGEPYTAVCDMSAGAPVGRVSAPRRLHIRCPLRARVKLLGEALPGISVGEQETAATETLWGEATVGRRYAGMGELLPLQDDLILPPGEGEWRVVCAEGSVLMNAAAPAADAVLCRGEVTVKLTLCPAETDAAFSADTPTARPSSALTILQRKIPFDQTVELTGVTPAATATARGLCTELAVQMEEGHVHVDLGVLCEVRAESNEPVTYVKDLYSTRQNSVARQASFPTVRALQAFNGNVSLNDSLPLEEVGISPDARMADVVAVAAPEALQYLPDKGRCVLTGTCRAHLLLLRDGEYSAADMELPFRYEFDLPALTGDELPAFDGAVDVVNCRARMDGERVALDAELAVSLATHCPAPLTALADVTFGDTVTRRRGEYVVCFPAPTDTLWSVAKRYNAPLTALTAANNLPAAPADSAESIEGASYLIV